MKHLRTSRMLMCTVSAVPLYCMWTCMSRACLMMYLMHTCSYIPTVEEQAGVDGGGASVLFCLDQTAPQHYDLGQ